MAQEPTTPPPPPRAKRGAKAQAQAAAAPEMAAPAPGSDDPEWVDAMVELAHLTVHRPAEERKNQVSSWETSYTANPGKAKADLDLFNKATRRLLAIGTTPNPDTDPEGYRKAFADVCTTLQEERRAVASSVPQEVADFVDGMADGNFGPKPTTAPPAAPAPDPELEDLLEDLADLLRLKKTPVLGEAVIAASIKTWRDASLTDTTRLRTAIQELQAQTAPAPAAAPVQPPPAAPAPAEDGRPPRATAEAIFSLLDPLG